MIWCQLSSGSGYAFGFDKVHTILGLQVTLVNVTLREKGTADASVVVPFLSLWDSVTDRGKSCVGSELQVRNTAAGRPGAGAVAKSSHLDPPACGRVRVIERPTLGVAWARQPKPQTPVTHLLQGHISHSFPSSAASWGQVPRHRSLWRPCSLPAGTDVGLMLLVELQSQPLRAGVRVRRLGSHWRWEGR